MALASVRPPQSKERSEERERRPRVQRAGHKARFRASLAWALKEYASTLAKLAR